MQKSHVAQPEGQAQLFRRASQLNAQADETFLHLVRHGMTQRDLPKTSEKPLPYRWRMDSALVELD